MKFQYTNLNVPRNYKCSCCKKSGIKLWRQYNITLDRIKLLCANCLQNKYNDYFYIRNDGSHLDKTISNPTYELNGNVPAIPTTDGKTFWGYLSVPNDAIEWWKALPLEKKK